MDASKKDKQIKADFPVELTNQVKHFHETLKELESVMEPLLNTDSETLKTNLEPLDRARLDLAVCYGATSLLWSYLLTQGEDPKKTALTSELERVKTSMNRIREIEDKDKRPKLQVPATKAFVRNALFDPTKQNVDKGTN